MWGVLDVETVELLLKILKWTEVIVVLELCLTIVLRGFVDGPGTFFKGPPIESISKAGTE